MPRFYILLFLIVLLKSCTYQTKSSSLDQKSKTFNAETLDSLNYTSKPSELNSLNSLTTETLDSLSKSLGKTNDADDYKVIEYLLKNSKLAKDSLVLVKTQYFISYLYFVSKNYEESKKKSIEGELLSRRLSIWEEMNRAITHQARIFRQQGKFDSIEPKLRNGYEEMLKLKQSHFAELYPIHELAVHYSYDRKEHQKAIEYGEFFLTRLAHFDSLLIENENFKEIKEYRKDVIDLILGVSYLKVGKFESSYVHLNQALLNYTKRNDTEKLSRVHKAFIEYYLETGNKEKLIYHKEEYYKNTLKYISTFSESQKEINALKIKVIEDEQALQALQEENRSKSLLIYLSIAGLLILALFWSYRSKLIQEKKEVALQLDKQYEFNEFKTDLLVTVAHELRTPLTIILGHLQLITDKKIKPEKFKLYFNKIKGNSENILNKMSDIIHLLKEDSTETIAVPRTIEVQPFLKGLFFSFEGVASIKKIELVINSQIDQGHAISTDPKILSGLLNNLIVNAIKFSPSGSKVEMRVCHNGKELIVDVIDDGIGISNKDQNKIFDKFNRVSTAAKIDGFGLGLAIVKKSTEQLNGTIEVKSSLGEGSTFTLTLPNESTVSTVEQKPSTASKLTNGIITKSLDGSQLSKVLVVEDNPEMCSFYQHIFSGVFDCTFAFNGREGLETLLNNNFDIIISDVMMPEMDGFQLKEKIRSVPKSKNIPFVMVTAKDQDESKIQAFDIGVDDYVVKPFNKNELIARIKSLITNKKEREKWSISNISENTTERETFDVKTVRKLRETVLSSCNDEAFSVADLAREVDLSQRQLVRVTKKLTGLTPVKFILEVRLLEAYKKIKCRDEADINNVRFAVGIQSASYFSTQFKKRFGINPKNLFKEHEKQHIKLN